MRGKVKYIRRKVETVVNSSDYHSHDYHGIRTSSTWATLYNGDVVLLNENDILQYYGRNRFSDNLIQTLNNDLHNCYINYRDYFDGTYQINGSISNYINQ